MPEPAVGVRCVADATPQTSARLAALLFVLHCHIRREAAPEIRLDDEKGRSSNDSLASNHSTT